MIIGSAIKKVIDEAQIEVTYENKDLITRFSYGNQDMLDKFIAETDARSGDKFPLLFYVTNPVKEINGWKYCDTTIIIMTNTNPNWLSEKRKVSTFDEVIEPIYYEVVDILTKHPYIQDMSANKIDRFSYTDVPNFGLLESTGNNALKDHNQVGRKKSEKSVVTDYVDARVVNLKLKINTNCIKNKKLCQLH